MNGKSYLLIEFLIICLVLPGIIIFGGNAPFLFAFLWGASLYGFLMIHYNHFTSYGDIWRFAAVNAGNMKPIVGRWVPASIAMAFFMAVYDPEHIFYLPREAPHVLPYIIFVYPLFSALPQEFIFCSFFFTRYKPFFGIGRRMVLMSALVFAYAHVLYINPVAPVISFLGGLIFALTYRKTGSLALVTLEHSLYGITLFVTGLGWYFYSGNIGG